MKPLCIDVETTTFEKGNPHAQRNKLCLVGGYDGHSYRYWDIEWTGSPYGEKLHEIQHWLLSYDLLVGFNFKFDLAWLRRYGILSDFNKLAVFDCQLVDFICYGQRESFPSLDCVARKRGFDGKYGSIDDWVKQGLDTPDFPKEEFLAYLEQDCKLTWQVFQQQLKELKEQPKLKRLCWNSCQDSRVTAEMEWNGLKYNIDKSRRMGDEFLVEIQEIDAQLQELAPDVGDKWNSNDWLSAILYGGCVFVDGVEEYSFTHKDGRVTQKSRKIKKPIRFERLVEPLKGSKLKKEGFFSVDENNLKHLKATGKAKKIIDLILERNKLEKKVGTYFHGIPKLYEKMDWSDNILHGQLTHAAAVTGRLSSSKPNQQNLDKEVRKCIVSRFKMKNNKPEF